MDKAVRDLNATSPAPAALTAEPRRDAWRRVRIRMESGKEKHTPRGVRKGRHWATFKRLVDVFGIGLRVLGLYGRGRRNALDLRLTRLELGFAGLPEAFDGFRVLHLSDLHVDFLPETMRAALRLVVDVDVDLCVLTGDYRRRVSGPFEHILPAFRELVSTVKARHGIYAVLGNHDCADLVTAFEDLGISVLVNETRCIQRNGQRIHVTGTDDVHYYYTEAAAAALDATPHGFKIALVHSAELADAAAERGFSLYLAGHTHGGQVCWPGGRPIITHMVCHRGYASGLWRHGAMIGYTNTGTGVSGLPVRFNNRGEVALITLRRDGRIDGAGP